MADTKASFKRFPNLSLELQQAVWGYYCSTPRFITFHCSRRPFHADEQVLTSRGMSVLTDATVLLRCINPTPSILHVSSSAREEGLRHYQPLFSSSAEEETIEGVSILQNGPNVYFHTAGIDTIYVTASIAETDEELQCMICQAAYDGIYSLADMPVKHFAFDFSLLSFLHTNEIENGEGCDIHFLEWLAFLNYEDREDVTFVVNQRGREQEIKEFILSSSTTINIQLSIHLENMVPSRRLQRDNRSGYDWSMMSKSFQHFSRRGQCTVSVLLAALPENLFFSAIEEDEFLPAINEDPLCPAIPPSLKVSTYSFRPLYGRAIQLDGNLDWWKRVCCGKEVIISARLVDRSKKVRFDMAVSLGELWAMIMVQISDFNNVDELQFPKIKLGKWI